MQKIKELIAKEVAAEIGKINPACGITEADVLGMFEYPPDNSLGDIALPCFKLSKTLRMAPVKIADGLASAISLLIFAGTKLSDSPWMTVIGTFTFAAYFRGSQASTSKPP